MAFDSVITIFEYLPYNGNSNKMLLASIDLEEKRSR
jgi:hypothetical protein